LGDAFLDVLPLAVLLVEIAGDFRSFGGVRAQQ
jgi:hypothetical protein